MSTSSSRPRLSRRGLLTVASAGALWPTVGAVSAAEAVDQGLGARAGVSASVDWREQYAYNMGIQAYVFGYPYIFLPTVRYRSVALAAARTGVMSGALNHFTQRRTLSDATYRGGGSPNQDTLYSNAWLDLSIEPIILSHGEMGDRYFTFEIASLDSDNFAYIGSRTTGGRPGRFAIIGPKWSGRLPSGIVALPRSRTNSALIFGRTLVKGPSDFATVNALQDGYSLVPLSRLRGTSADLPARRDVWAPADPATDPLAEWRTFNRATTEDPPEARLAPLLATFATVGLGPGQDLDSQSQAVRDGLARAAVDGRKLLMAAGASGQIVGLKSGWTLPTRLMGRAGLHDAFLMRSAIQCMMGIISNDPEEAIYQGAAVDAEGRALFGGKRYFLSFRPDLMPKVKAFWSVALYDPTNNFVANEISRYSIGDRTPGLQLDKDGGLTIYIQPTPPAGTLQSNWLPSPSTGSFHLVFRRYVPDPKTILEAWTPPAIQLAT